MNVYKKTLHIALSLVIIATFVVPSQIFANDDITSVDSVDSTVSAETVSESTNKPVAADVAVDVVVADIVATPANLSVSNTPSVDPVVTVDPCAPCKADLNHDGKVNQTDLDIVIANWTPSDASRALTAHAAICSTPTASRAACKAEMKKLALSLSATALTATQPTKLEGDINGNGSVNVDDLLAVIQNWGDCPVPPPSCTTPVPPTTPNGSTGGGHSHHSSGGSNGNGGSNAGEVLGESTLPGLPYAGTGASAMPMIAALSGIFGTLGLLGAKKVMIAVK